MAMASARFMRKLIIFDESEETSEEKNMRPKIKQEMLNSRSCASHLASTQRNLLDSWQLVKM